jgi:hypothetical protein
MSLDSEKKKPVFDVSMGNVLLNTQTVSTVPSNNQRSIQADAIRRQQSNSNACVSLDSSRRLEKSPSIPTIMNKVGSNRFVSNAGISRSMIFCSFLDYFHN